MHALKVSGIVVLALWMTFITLRIERVASMSETACAWALYAAKSIQNPRTEGVIFCPAR